MDKNNKKLNTFGECIMYAYELGQKRATELFMEALKKIHKNETLYKNSIIK